MEDAVMTRLVEYTMICVFVLTFSGISKAATNISENIVFLEEDGQHCLSYSTTRSDTPKYNFWYDKEKFPKQDDVLSRFFYFYPNNYTWDAESNPQYNLLQILQPDYAALLRKDLNEDQKLRVGEDGVFTYQNWDEETKTAEGHYGDWISPDNFSQYAYVWVFPQKFEIVSYKCNRSGDWVKRHNTIAYYGKDVNDLVFTITYRSKSQATYEALTKTLAGQEQVQVEQQEEGVEVTVAATILFPTGKSELSEKGKAILVKVIEALKERGAVNIVIEGHTDNVPIRGTLARKYPTNWELSGARAFTTLHYLAEQGIPESRLEARAFGEQRPVASNETAEGREKNRRMVLMIVEEAEP
jgi:flagellar motor protein MotB